MSVSGINNYTNDAYNTNAINNNVVEDTKATQNTSPTTPENTGSATETAKPDDTAVVYDKRKLSEDDRMAIKEQLKADQEKRQEQFHQLILDMMNKQTTTFGVATDDDAIWKFLAKGDFEVDEETKLKAQEAISEDGYWGVEKTSDRIVEFATSLAGNDEKALEEMREAFKKGYKEAEKAWGGELPEISKKTYDAVMEKFDKLMKKDTDEKSDKVTSSTDDGKVVVKDTAEKTPTNTPTKETNDKTTNETTPNTPVDVTQELV